MKNYKYPLLYDAKSGHRRKLAQALKLTPRQLRLKQHPKCKSDFTGEEMRRASKYLGKPVEKIFANAKGGGYVGILSERGNYVPQEQAAEYAMVRCGIAPRGEAEVDAEFLTWFTDWFYSGNWLTQEEYNELLVGNKEVL